MTTNTEYLTLKLDMELETSQERQQQIITALVRLPKIMPYLPNDFVERAHEINGYVSLSVSKNLILTCTIPWQAEIADEIALKLQNLGWAFTKEWDTSYGGKPDRYLEFVHEDLDWFSVKINMEANRMGSCELIQVGTRTQEIPIWQINCEEGDDEETQEA